MTISEEEKAHRKDIEGFMEFMEGICENCGNKRKECPNECAEKSIQEMGSNFEREE